MCNDTDRLINGEYVVNPTLAQKDISDLQLTVASTRDKVIMIEAGANEIPEAKMIELFLLHMKSIRRLLLLSIQLLQIVESRSILISHMM